MFQLSPPAPPYPACRVADYTFLVIFFAEFLLKVIPLCCELSVLLFCCALLPPCCVLQRDAMCPNADRLLQLLYLSLFVLKVVAYGFCLSSRSYMSDAWNRLDILVPPFPNATLRLLPLCPHPSPPSWC